MYSKKDFGFSADFLKTVASVMSKNRNMTVSEIQEKLDSDVWSADTPILEGKEALIYDRQLNRRISVNVISEAMDPVNKKALKKDFDDREDKDIDNDGDTDDSDEYLHKRRKVISKAMKEEVLDEAQKLFMFKTKQEADKKAKEIKGKVIELGPKNFAVVTKDLTVIEEVELDELSKKTLGSYVKGASHDIATKSDATGRYAERANKARKTGDYSQYKDDETADKMFNKSLKRRIGVAKAVDKLTKEESDVDEGFINLGGTKVKDDEKSILQHIKKTFPNVKKVKKDSQHGWIPVFEANKDLEEGKKGYKKESDDSSNDEKMTDAQKNDMNGDGDKDKKNEKKKNREKVDSIDTDPEMSDTMVQERAGEKLASYEREKLDDLKKKHEGGKMHRALRRQYGDKGDEIFYGKLTKMAKDEYDGSQSKSEEFQLTSEDLNTLDELQRLGQQFDEARGRPPKGDDADDGGSKNFVMQMRKSVSLRGQNTVIFDDGSKMKVDQRKAQTFLNRFMDLKKPAEKEMLMKSASKSSKHFDMALQGKVAKDSKPSMLPPLKSEK
jgi:hypothetical protein